MRSKLNLFLLTISCALALLAQSGPSVSPAWVDAGQVETLTANLPPPPEPCFSSPTCRWGQFYFRIASSDAYQGDHTCNSVTDPVSNLFYMENDGTVGQGGAVPWVPGGPKVGGQPGTWENSQCILDVSRSRSYINPNKTATTIMTVQFKNPLVPHLSSPPDFYAPGGQERWMWALGAWYDTSSGVGGWHGWFVLGPVRPSASAPQWNWITPSWPPGQTPGADTFTVRIPPRYWPPGTSWGQVYMRVSQDTPTPSRPDHGCTLIVGPSGNVFFMEADGNNPNPTYQPPPIPWLPGPGVLGGSSGTWDNGQCTFSGQSSSATSGSDGSATVIARVTYKPSFAPAGGLARWLWIQGLASNGEWLNYGAHGLIHPVAASDPPITSLTSLQSCLANTSRTECKLEPNTYTVAQGQGLIITRYGVTLSGNGSTRNQTKLVRAPGNTDPLITVNAPNPPSPFTAQSTITIQNLTICGSSTLRGSGISSAGCPRDLTICGGMTSKLTPGAPAPPNNNQLPANPFLCTDLSVDSVDTGLYQPDPFASAGPYALTINNVDFEDAAGHALALFSNATPGQQKKVNDVYVHHSAFVNSEVTGIVYGTNGTVYHSPVCDNDPTFKNRSDIYAPRNIRIDGFNTFADNHTGAMGGGAMRWVMLRGNTFTNNYTTGRAGNFIGGTVEFDPCVDTLHVIGNTFTGPTSFL